MGDVLDGGAGLPNENSLAGYFEEELDAVRRERGLDPLPEDGRDDRMLMWLSIARGLVRYLDDNTAAFVVEAHDSGSGSRHDEDSDGYVRIQVVHR